MSNTSEFAVETMHEIILDTMQACISIAKLCKDKNEVIIELEKWLQERKESYNV